MDTKHFNYRGCLVWLNYHNAFYCALGNLKADSLQGIKVLIDNKLTGGVN